MRKHTKLALTVSIVFFLLVFLLHLLRVIFGWNAEIGNLSIPIWASFVALVVSAFLVWLNYKAL